jgi:hypothetical protein
MKFPGLAFALACGIPLAAQQPLSPGGANFPFPISEPASAKMDPNKVVLQVGDIKITAQQLDALIEVYPSNTQVFVRGSGRDQFADSIVRMLVLAQEARKRKLDETEKVKQQLRFSESNLLANALTEQIRSEVQPDEGSLQKFYDAHHCEYQVWHPHVIVVRTIGSPLPIKEDQKELSDADAKAKAQDIRNRLVAGVDFASIARTESDDLTTRENGGDMGTVRHGQLMPVVEEAVCGMEAGDLSQPVKTPIGFQIIKLESKEVTPFEKAKGEIETRYRPEAAKKLIDEMISRTKVVKDPDYYGGPPAGPAGESKRP